MRLEWRDKTPYLVFHDYLSDEPKRTASGFRIVWAEKPLPESDCDVYKTAISGVYQAGSVRFNVQNPSEFYESFDVPAPKVRKGTELRWRYGWEKLTRKGWEPA
jgi:hypothetical protein